MNQVTYTRTFNAELNSLPDDAVEGVGRALQTLRNATESHPRNLTKLKSLASAYRLRVGPYRIIFSKDNGAWKALCVRHRSVVYRSLGQSVHEDAETADDPFELDTQHVADAGPLFPITADQLARWRIPEAYWPELVGLECEDHLLELTGVPYEVFSDLVDLLYPSDIDQLHNSAAYVLPELEDLKVGWTRSLLGFMLHLDEEQQQIAEMKVATQQDASTLKNPILVKGGPGSGKSTVALYRIRKILETFGGSLFEPPKILFLTYTNALCAANRALLNELLGTVPSNVQIATLDSFAHSMAARRVKVGEILDENGGNTQDLFALAREKAGNPEVVRHLSDQYLIEEVFQVIEGTALQERKDYLKIDRRGRKARLSEAQRKAVWEIYFQFMDQMGNTYRTREDVRYQAYLHMKQANAEEKFDFVIVDEAQDFSPHALRLAVELCRHPGGLYLTADTDQSLYQKGFSWRGIHEALDFGQNVRTLRKNYRNTRQVTEASRSFLISQNIDIDKEQIAHIDGGGNGPKPSVLLTTAANETALLKQRIQSAAKAHRQPISNVTILVAGDQEHAYGRGKEIATNLSDAGIKTRYMASRDLRLDAECVKVMSLYTSKGLEFPIVLIVDLHDGVVPRHVMHLPSEERSQERDKDVRLLYVGMSRAMRDLTLVSRLDTTSEFIHDLDDEFWDIPN